MKSDDDFSAGLERIDAIHDLIKDLSVDTTGKALIKADHYLKKLSTDGDKKDSPKTFDRTVINKCKDDVSQTDPSAFMAAVEKDAAERAARRKINMAKAEKKKKKANDYINAGDLHNAIQLYSEAIELTRDNLTLYVNRAMAYYRDAQYEESLKDCDLVLNVDPNFVKAHFHRGKALLALEKFDGALEAFDKAVKINPNLEKSVKEFQNQARLLQQKGGNRDPAPSDSCESDASSLKVDAGLWSQDDLRQLLVQLSMYNGLQPPSNCSGGSVQTDLFNQSYFGLGLQTLTRLMLRGDTDVRATHQQLFRDKGGFTLLTSSKHLIIKALIHVEPSALRAIDLPILLVLWQVAHAAVIDHEMNSLFVAKETPLVDIAISQLRHFTQTYIQNKSSTPPPNHDEGLICGACVQFLAQVFRHGGSILAWLDRDPVPGQPKAQQFLLLILKCLRLATSCLAEWRIPSEGQPGDRANLVRYSLESLLRAFVQSYRLKTALCHHPGGVEWIKEWETMIDVREHLPRSSMLVIVESYSELISHSVSQGGLSPPLCALKISANAFKQIVSLWCQRYLFLHKDPRYTSLLRALATLLCVSWRKVNDSVRPQMSDLLKQVISSTTGALSVISPTQIELRPTLLSVLDAFITCLTEDEISLWCQALDPPSTNTENSSSSNASSATAKSTAVPLQFENPFKLFSNIDSLEENTPFHEKLSAVIHVLLGILRELRLETSTKTSSPDSEEPMSNVLLSLAIKLLAIATQHDLFVQARLGDDVQLVQKLSTFINPDTHANGILVANASLCLRHCLNSSKAATHLHHTDIMKSLLRQCNAVKIPGNLNAKQDAGLRANCAILAGTLARTDTCHYEEFHKLQGLEIVRHFLNWEKHATV